MTISDHIVRYETAPVTDAEWEEALNQYAPVEHNDNAVASSSRRTLDTHRPSIQHSSSDDSTSSGSGCARPGSFPIDRPHVAEHQEIVGNDTELRSGELARIRHFYEKEGWLPAPRCSKATRRSRKRVLQRLGLLTEDKGELHKLLAQHADMAKMICSTSAGLVAVMHDEQVHAHLPDPSQPIAINPAPQTGCSQTIARPKEDCLVIADATTDWRFMKNPLFKKYRIKFYASVPLRFRPQQGSPVDFGSLCIFDSTARDTFDGREREILRKSADMLVQQLETLQSANVAKHSTAMFSASLDFLQRAINPSLNQPDGADKGQTKRGKDGRPKAGPAGIVPTKPMSDASFARKAGPRHRPGNTSDYELFADAAATQRKILNADAVVIVSMEDYQVFIRDTAGDRGRVGVETREHLIRGFLKGEPWPADIEPVTHYVPRHHRRSDVPVLGLSTKNNETFHLTGSTVTDTLADFLQDYLSRRHYLWDRDDQDELSQKIMALMPAESQTVLGTAFMSYDGKVRFATFASWDHSHASFVEATATALPFAWTLSGCVMAALAIRKMRVTEQSQTSYSNLQAHELRTPLHQILAMTQLLRSSVDGTAWPPGETTQRVQDLVPFLDAIENGGRSLNGIVDNILSYLDLRAQDESTTHGYFAPPTGAQTSLEQMFEHILRDATEEDKQVRKADGRSHSRVETVFEIIPPLLGETVSEDPSGGLRRALSKVLANAYKFLKDEGFVEIYVDDIPELMPPDGFEDISLTRIISITIKDNGRGMEQSFINEKLGEPWAKEDAHVTGSGLSVHLAYRLIELIGGHMEIASAPGAGCKVQIDVPLPVRKMATPTLSMPDVETSGRDPLKLLDQVGKIGAGRKIAVAGFHQPDHPMLGLEYLGASLKRQFSKLGCKLVSVEEADLVFVNGDEEMDSKAGLELLGRVRTDDVVFLVGTEHQAHQEVTAEAEKRGLKVRRFRKPPSPSILRECLFPQHAKRLKSLSDDEGGGGHKMNEPTAEDKSGGRVDMEGNSMAESDSESESANAHPDDLEARRGKPTSSVKASPRSEKSEKRAPKPTSSCSWKPDQMPVEEAIATLSIGRRLYPEEGGGDGEGGSLGDTGGTERHSPVTTPQLETNNVIRGFGRIAALSDSEPESESESESDAETKSVGNHKGAASKQDEDKDEEKKKSSSNTPIPATTTQQDPAKHITVLVVEDNTINRKILVKILQNFSDTEVSFRWTILDAEDGEVAVEKFKRIEGKVIVLLDINMPHMDGYATSTTMRKIENSSSDSSGREKSCIIAVTALGGEEDKRRGLEECGMDRWLVKPCGKACITEAVVWAKDRFFTA